MHVEDAAFISGLAEQEMRIAWQAGQRPHVKKYLQLRCCRYLNANGQVSTASSSSRAYAAIE